MKFPYKALPDGKGGVIYHAFVPVYIGLPVPGAPRSKKIEALVDSGASRTTFHSSIGKALGFNIEDGEIEEPLGFGGKSGATYVHEVALYAPG